MAGDLHAKKHVLMTVGRLYWVTSEVAFLLALPELSHSMRYGVEDRCEILMYSRVHSAFAATFALSHMKWTCFRKRQSSQLPAPAFGDTALKIAAKYSCTRVYTPLSQQTLPRLTTDDPYLNGRQLPVAFPRAAFWRFLNCSVSREMAPFRKHQPSQLRAPTSDNTAAPLCNRLTDFVG